MAVTDTPPETVEAAAAEASEPRPLTTGLAAVIGSGDHKVIGRMYIVASLILGALVLGLGAGVAFESTTPATLELFPSDFAYSLFTLARLGGLFLVAFPLVIGISLVVVPLQVGARSVAFPRAAAASFWGWLLGSILLLVAYGTHGGPGGTGAKAIDLWTAAMMLIVLSLLLAAISLATTVLALRTNGMTLARVPLFAWSVMVAAVMWLLTLPVLFGHLVLMYVDHRRAGSILIGGSSQIFPAMGWLLRNPQVYVVAIPVLGFIADVAINLSGSRIHSRSAARVGITLFGVLSFGAFMVFPTQKVLDSPIVVVPAILAVVPLLAVAATVADAGRRAARFNAPVAYAGVAFLVLLLGVVAGAIGSIPGVLDAPKDATTSANIFFIGVGNAVLFAAVIAALGGATWWATKVGGRPAGDAVGIVAALVLLAGAVVATIPDMVSGITGSGAELIGDYRGGVEVFNWATLGGFGIFAVGLVLAVFSLARSMSAPEEGEEDDSPADPWGGQTLEWLTASPPPLENFDGELAVVRSAEPLIDLQEEK
ncbi:MAG: cbb3-type cytochrome c oxidase subunit I [Acidimicrobiales bacterium]